MRLYLACVFYAVLGISCKTIHKNPSRLKVIQGTPEAGVSGILDKAPLLIEPGKPAVVSINRMAGSPPADGELRLERVQLTFLPSDGYADCKPNLEKAVFTETVEKDIQSPDDFLTRASYRMQDISMTVAGNPDGSWTLSAEGGHDIGDLYLEFDNKTQQTCQVSAIGHGYYAVNSTGAWGTGSGDVERDRLVRAWGTDRGHRLWHYLWHGMRSQWMYMDQKDKDALISHYGPGVAPPQRNRQGTPDGEDFLYMHHNMLKTISQSMASQGKTMVPAWKVLPRFDDKNHPSTDWGSDQETFDTWEKDYRDIEKVKGMTLGEYGQRIEQTIHNNMHMRFLNPADMEIPGDPLDPEWERKFSRLFDDPSYDYLGGTYSSHVNPVFFMLHGWVDDRIQTWLEAHGYKSIGSAEECSGKTDCYVWLSDKAYAADIDRKPWEGVAPGPSRNGMALHQHSVPTGPVPGLSVKARARLYQTRRMGGFR
ncbi:MAG TPA: hypothetical protein VFO10_11495 [Oligoflexus sp.]|uniref:hypothetical protein n=1 Tax=Oligoflexus sp. TaxID=1971216 RepID=UPI002D80541F|nr:hypothetical protein [Oligoflexus sp.]HET9237870.1 hypothetical protein [Oligoflexus sp.]